MSKSNIISKEYTKTKGKCKKAGCRQDCKNAGCKEECKKVPNSVFYDTNCRDRCDKNSSCTAYLISPMKTGTNNWCTIYTSIGLAGNGRQNWDCWLKGK